jgi:hypothetical protein
MKLILIMIIKKDGYKILFWLDPDALIIAWMAR